MTPQDFLNPRAFFKDLGEREQNLFGPLRVALLVVLISSLIPVFFVEFQREGGGWAFFQQSFVVGVTVVAVLMASVRLVAWSPSPIRAPEIVGYALTPVLYALGLFAVVGYFVWPLGVAVMTLGATLCGYFIFVGVDVLVGRAQAWRVLAALPVIVVLALALATITAPRPPA